MKRKEIVGKKEESVVAPAVVRQKPVEISCTVVQGVSKLRVGDGQSAVGSPRENVRAHDHLDARSGLCVLNQGDVSLEYGLRICGIEIISPHVEDHDADTGREQVDLLHEILDVPAALGHEHRWELSAGRLKLSEKMFYLRVSEDRSDGCMVRVHPGRRPATALNRKHREYTGEKREKQMLPKCNSENQERRQTTKAGDANK